MKKKLSAEDLIKQQSDEQDSFEGSQRVRKRVQVIFGTDDHKGLSHTWFEILSNSIDEAKKGYGNMVKTIKHKDGSYTVIDEGRGMPIAWNERMNRYNWQNVMAKLYAGGNQGSNSEALGINGLGMTSTMYASEYFVVKSFQIDGLEYDISFKEGRVVDYETKEFFCADDEVMLSKEDGARAFGVKKQDGKIRTGTIINYKPDSSVFIVSEIETQFMIEKLNLQAMSNLGMSLILIDETELDDVGKPKEYYFKYDSIEEYIDTLIEDKDKTISSYHNFKDSGAGRDSEDRPEYNYRYEVGFLFDNDYKGERITCMHNSSHLYPNLSDNATYKSIELGFLRSIEKLINDNNGYKSTDKGKINFKDDIADSLIIVLNSFSNITSYANQTKLSISNKFIRKFTTESIKKYLDIYFTENKLESEKIMNQILINFRARIRADETKKNIKKKFNEKLTLTNRIKKFVDCISKDPKVRVLHIAEGDSALGSCKLARDSKTQALMPVRGKILNCLKADYDKIFANDIIVDLIKILKCGVEVKNKKLRDSLPEFDIKKLDFSKIIITTDADVDGFHIRMLLLMMIYKLMPQLIIQGYIYYVETPLFEITNGKDTYFAYSDDEKNSIIKGLSGNIKIERSKGLGENEPEMMWETAMNPETARTIQVTMEEFEDGLPEFLEAYMGDDLESRKEIVADAIEQYYKGSF